MKFQVLCSGSSGNATVISYNGKHLLIDCGIGKRTLIKMLAQHEYLIEDFVGCFITHRHHDHLVSPDQLFSLFGKERVFALPETIPDANNIDVLKQYNIESFYLFPLPLSHDIPCAGLVIVCGDQKLVYMTDTGYINSRLFPLISNADIYLIESNYDEEMLVNSGRDLRLIKRIIGSDGHLSNEECGDVLNVVIGERTKEIVLMHISNDCNTPELALSTVQNCLQDNKCINNIKITTSQRLEKVRQ